MHPVCLPVINDILSPRSRGVCTPVHSIPAYTSIPYRGSVYMQCHSCTTRASYNDIPEHILPPSLHQTFQNKASVAICILFLWQNSWIYKEKLPTFIIV